MSISVESVKIENLTEKRVFNKFSLIPFITPQNQRLGLP